MKKLQTINKMVLTNKVLGKLLFLICFLGFSQYVLAKSNPYNEINFTLAENSTYFGLPLTAGTQVTLRISNQANDFGKLLSAVMYSDNGFQFGHLNFKYRITVSLGEPGISAFGSRPLNDRRDEVYKTALKSDMGRSIKVRGALKERTAVEGIMLKENSSIAVFCRTHRNNCNVNDISNWYVLYGRIAEDYEINGVQLLSDDYIYFQPTTKRKQLLAFSGHRFRPITLVNDNIRNGLTVLAQAVIFNDKGFTTALYAKEGEQLFGFPLKGIQSGVPLSNKASIEIYQNGRIKLATGYHGQEIELSPSGQPVEKHTSEALEPSLNVQ